MSSQKPTLDKRLDALEKAVSELEASREEIRRDTQNLFQQLQEANVAVEKITERYERRYAPPSTCRYS